MRDKSEQTRMAFFFGPTVFSTTSWATWHWFHTSLNIACVYSLMMIINKNQFHSICKKWGVHAELVPGNLRFSLGLAELGALCLYTTRQFYRRNKCLCSRSTKQVMTYKMYFLQQGKSVRTDQDFIQVLKLISWLL